LRGRAAGDGDVALDVLLEVRTGVGPARAASRCRGSLRGSAFSTAAVVPRLGVLTPETPVDPPRRFHSFRGGKLAYTATLRDAAPTLLAVHGLPGSVRDFRWLESAVGEEVSFVRVELPGYGQSTRTTFRGETIEHRAAAVVELARSLELESVTLVGHSAGSVVCAHVARHHPELVEGCVFLAPPGLDAHYNHAAYRVLSIPLRSAPVRVLAAPLLRQLYRLAGFPSYLTDDERVFTLADASVQDFGRYRDEVQALTQPLLVAWAADDRLIPEALSQRFADALGSATQLRFETGGHNVQKTHAVEIADAIRGFST